jgi:cytokinin dehydrogenase
LNLFLPDRAVETMLDEVLPELDTSADGDLGPPEIGVLGQIQLVPLLRRHLGRPLLRVPDDDLVFLFEMRTCATSNRSSAAYRARLLDRNRRLYERARTVGGTRYATAAIPFSRADWIRHLGPAYGALAEQKRAHDPDHLLGASVGMF